MSCPSHPKVSGERTKSGSKTVGPNGFSAGQIEHPRVNALRLLQSSASSAMFLRAEPECVFRLLLKNLAEVPFFVFL